MTTVFGFVVVTTLAILAVKYVFVGDGSYPKWSNGGLNK